MLRDRVFAEKHREQRVKVLPKVVRATQVTKLEIDPEQKLHYKTFVEN